MNSTFSLDFVAKRCERNIGAVVEQDVWLCNEVETVGLHIKVIGERR